MKTKVLITGGSGFIGTNLVNYLLNKNYIITNIDKLSKHSNLKNLYQKYNNYSFYKFNIKNEKKLSKVLTKNFDFIIHLAAESHVDRSIKNPASFFLENVKSTFILYNAINKLVVQKKIKSPQIIHVSTDEIYGSILKGSSKESSNTFTSSPYSASKASSENIAQAFMTTFGLSVCIIRICNNYGPYQNKEKFIPKSILSIKKEGKIYIYSKGKNVREWMHVNDTCNAIYKIIKKFKNKKIFNIGSTFKKTNNQLAKLIIKNSQIKFKDTIINYIKDRKGHDFRYSLNSNLFSKTYKWKAKIQIDEGIKDTINWFSKKND